ncbi:MAG: class I mannose-6-phosphate isomerase [bacterium]|nr:class I mannose-6-phosphate isomerase [bacterium]
MQRKLCFHQPVKLKPAFQNYIWGGTKFRDYYRKDTPKNWQKIAESWELSTHEHGLTTIAEGDFKDWTLKQYLDKAGPKILGKRFATTRLPILFKLIDAKDNLSVQVHPTDDYARKYEKQMGKTEMWYILDAEPKSFLYYGFKKKINAKEFAQRIADQTLTEILQAVPVKKGDVFFIPAGTLHAIGKGILIAEIQQSSDLTYRVYDYGRVGDDGKPRELHIEKALEVTKLEKAHPRKMHPAIPLQKKTQIQTLASCPYFVVKELKLDQEIELLVLDDTYQVLFATKNDFVLTFENKKLKIKEGETVFLPADLGNYKITGSGELLMITDN